MKSPFPGMDPYLEACGLWAGFHNRLIHNIDEKLAQALPRGYIIDIGMRRYTELTHSEAKKDPITAPYVIVSIPSNGDLDKTVESVQMQAFVAETFEETFVEIYAEGENRVLVTCIEVLSPSNKRRGTKGWRKYLRKRKAMLLGQANFIEIDLLRGGDKFPMLTPWPDAPYSLLVSKEMDAPYCRVWPASYRHRLPSIPVPLLEPDPDLTLDLQPLIDHIYTLGRYDERLDYTRPLTPVLPDKDAGWVRDLLKKERPPRSSRKNNKST